MNVAPVNANAAPIALPPPPEEVGKAAEAAAAAAAVNITERTAAAAATALAKPQHDNKLSAEVQAVLNCVHFLFLIPGKPKPNFDFLTVRIVVSLATHGLIFNHNNIPPAALLDFFKNYGGTDPNVLTENFIKYWKACNINPAFIKKYEEYYKIILTLEKQDHPNTAIIEQESNDATDARWTTHLLFNSLKKTILALQPFWKFIREELGLANFRLPGSRQAASTPNSGAQDDLEVPVKRIFAKFSHHFNFLFHDVVKEVQKLDQPNYEQILRLCRLCKIPLKMLMEFAKQAVEALEYQEYHIFTNSGIQCTLVKAYDYIFYNDPEFVTRAFFKDLGDMLLLLARDNPVIQSIDGTEEEVRKYLTLLKTNIDRAGKTNLDLVRTVSEGTTTQEAFSNWEILCLDLIRIYIDRLDKIFNIDPKKGKKIKSTLSHISSRFEAFLASGVCKQEGMNLSDALGAISDIIESEKFFGQPYDRGKKYIEICSMFPKGNEQSIDDFRFQKDRTVHMAEINYSVSTIIDRLSSYIIALEYLASEYNKQEITFQSSSLEADTYLHMLEMEERVALVVEGEADCKVGGSDIADEPLPQVETPKGSQAKPASPKMVQVIPFSNVAAQFIFRLRNEAARMHGIDEATVFAPDVFSQYAGIRRSPKIHAQLLHLSAQYQQVYSNDQFALTLELLPLCTDSSDKKIVLNMLLLWGYLALEQGVDVAYRKAFPNDAIVHDLQRLAQDLNLKGVPKSNLWMKEAGNHSLSHRYPWNYSVEKDAKFPFALRHMREDDGETVKQLEKDLTQWVHDAGQFQVEVLQHVNSAHSVIPKISALLAEFTKQKASAAQGDRKNDAAATSASGNKVMTGCVASLEKAAGQIQTYLKERQSQGDQKEDMAKRDKHHSLQNALHHLKMMQAGIKLFTRFPQQRYMHLIFHLLMSSAKNYTETYWTAVIGIPTHCLTKYYEYGATKRLKSDIVETVEMLDVRKGDEHPYSYFADTPAKKVSKAMITLSELYARSQEAVLVGEGATPDGMKEKSAAVLQAEMTDWVCRFTNLVCALAGTHLK